MSILQKFEALPIDKQKQVEEYIDFLLGKPKTVTLTPSISGRELVERFAGCISKEEADEMKQIVNAEFGQIDESAW